MVPAVTVPPSRTPLRVVAAVLGAVAAVRLVGTVVFTFFTAPEDGGVATSGDRVFAVWSGTMSAALLVVAVLLFRDSRPRVPLAVSALLVADLVFTVAKAWTYREPESVLFGVVDLVLLGAVLLVAPRRR